MPKKYTTEFKRQMVRLASEEKISIKELCALHGISRSILYKWIEEYSEADVKSITNQELKTFRKEYQKIQAENALYKQFFEMLSISIDEKARIVDTLKEEHSIYTLCRLIQLNHSTYLNRQRSKSTPKILELEDEFFREKIAIVFQQSNYRFGARKIRAKLQQQGYTISEKRIVRIMRQHNIKPPKPLKENATFQRKYKYYPNRIKQDFMQEKPNLVWVSDITFVRVGSGVAYLCVVIDLFSRMVIAHRISEFIDTELTSTTFQQAYFSRGKPVDLIFHSDQGVQYTAFDFRQLLSDHKVSQSFSSPGHPQDNAVAEAFFSALKKELFRFSFYETLEELKDSVAEYIDYYNTFRPHQSLHQKTPSEWEDAYKKAAEDF